ncbi:MAG: hypothetical protein HY717_21020 [Planctomycetes bacterium]|nr:hypothetical protein [Planctomycetota bacterium]
MRLARFSGLLSPTLLILAWLEVDLIFSRPQEPRPTAPPTVEYFNQQGVQFYEARQYHQAIESFKKALALAPHQADVRANLARAWSGLGIESLNSSESKLAGEAFLEALKVNDDAYAHFGLGYMDYLEMKDGEARKHLDGALKLSPDFAKAWKILSLIDYRQGKTADAIQRLEKACRLDGADVEAGVLLKRWKAEAEVSKQFKTFPAKRFQVRYDPEIPLAHVERLAGDLEAAAEAIRQNFGASLPAALVVNLFTEERFRQATGAYHWIGGLFDGQIKLSVFRGAEAAQRFPREAFKALQHELMHAAVREIYSSCPNWLNEGLAQFFETLPVPAPGESRAEAERRAAQERAERRKKVEEQLRKNRAQRSPLSRIPSRLWEATSEAEARWTYLQGLGFVEFLAGRYQIFRLRLLLEAARSEGSLHRAFQWTYGKKLEELEEEWWAALPPVAGE